MDREYREADVRLHRLLWPDDKIYRAQDGDRIYRQEGKQVWFDRLPEYWTTYAGAGLVIDRMAERGYRLAGMEELVNGRKRAVFVLRGDAPWWEEFDGFADTFPGAICAAAEAALKVGKGEIA